jgi:tetratricopeptide (TPR) repeat protein
MDPEDVRTLLARYHERVKTELERFGGTVEKFIGDAVMALFGAPVAHEDDPERAVRAALAIREWAEEEGELQVRIGITTGEALVALAAQPHTGEGMASGDVVNTAARLQSGAPENGVLVDETTYRATRRSIDYGDGRTVEAKGKKHPVSVWEAVQARARFGVDVRQEGGPALVGREAELDLIIRTLERVRREREPQLVTLVGVPGIGKSRLVYELFRHVDEEPELTTWRQGRSLPYGEGVSFWALGEMVKAQAGILETDGSDEAARKLHASIQELGVENGDWVEKHLRPLVGVEGAPATDDHGESFAAWRDYIEAMADQRPLVLVFEDLHWADEGLLDFVDELVEWTSGVPLLVVGTARPELLTRRSGWGGGKPNATTQSLGPLTRDETSRLVHALLERAVLPAETQAALLERAEGNPLYAEEFARLVAEGREPDELPETVQGLIAARLDALAPDEKALLQHASVLGKVFWAGAVAHLAGAEPGALAPLLHELVRRELTRRERRGSIAGETEFAFRHALVRDVAYAQIPRASRAEMHLRAAEWIELLGRPEDKVELLAHHYLAALELAAASHQPIDGFVDRARDAFRAAGERAVALHAYPAAQSYYGRALELSSDADPDYGYLLLGAGRSHAVTGEGGDDLLSKASERLVALGDSGAAAEAEVRLGHTAWLRGDPATANDHVDRAAALIAELEPSGSKAYVLAQIARRRLLTGNLDDAIEVGRQALALAVELELPDTQADASVTIGGARWSLGDPDGISDIKSGIAIAKASGSLVAIRGYNNLAWVLSLQGDPSRREIAEHTLELAKRFGQHRMVAFGRLNLLDYQYQEGEWELCLAVAEEFIVGAEAGAPHYQEPTCLTYRALIRLARGQDERALVDARSALDRARVIADPQIVYTQLAITAHIEDALGDRGAAERLVEELGRERLTSDLVLSEGLPVLELIELFGVPSDLAALGRGRTNTRFREAALAYVGGDLLGAAAIYAEIGFLVDEAQLRLRAAEQLLRKGRRTEASEQLDRAVDFYRSVGATRYLREAEELLRVSA